MRLASLFLLTAAMLPAQSASFDYYLLALSWAPEFCATHHSGQTGLECDPGRHRGFVVHGLWPQLANGPSPENCGSARPVAGSIINSTLNAMPSAGLIQHEWRTHGTCSGLDAATYFRDIVSDYSALQKPPLQGQMSPRQIEQAFAQANHTNPNSFRAECRGGELSEVRACVSKDLSRGLQFVQCTPSAGSCNAPSVMVRPIP
jgi:ribonuclease T2